MTLQTFEPPPDHHPFFSPSSGLPRAYFCPASAAFSHALKVAGIITDAPSKADDRAADRGTAIHRAWPPGASTDALDDHDQDLVGRCRAWWAERTGGAGHIEYEIPVQVHSADEKAVSWGWVDGVAVFEEQKHLVVCDIKTHREAPLTPDIWSIQLQAYASGLLSMYQAESADLWAYCPETRTDFHLPVTREDVAEFEALVSLIVRRAREEMGTFQPGPAQCQYCPARAHCPAARDAALELAEVERPTVPADLRRRGELLKRAESACRILGALVDLIKHEAYEGAVPEGYRVVDVRGRRYVPSLADAVGKGVDPMALLRRASISVAKLREACREVGADPGFIEDLPRGKPSKRLMREA